MQSHLLFCLYLFYQSISGVDPVVLFVFLFCRRLKSKEGGGGVELFCMLTYYLISCCQIILVNVLFHLLLFTLET